MQRDLTSVGVLISVVLLIIILVRQKPCQCGENYREYSGGFSGTSATGYMP